MTEEVYFQLLIAASLIIAGYQDIKTRLVSDLVWIPALVGAALVIYFDFTFALVFKLALVGGIGLAFAWYGAVGEADAIAFAFITADSFPLSPIPVLVVTGVVIAAHVAYLYASGKIGRSKVIGLPQFRSEASWIPKAVIVGGERRDVDRDVNTARDGVEALDDPGAMVEVQYGVPDVAYIALGYAAYLAYLALTQPSFLAAFP